MTAHGNRSDTDRPGAAGTDEEWYVEVKIGIQHAGRELVLESAQTPEQVEQMVSDAIGDTDGVLQLVDEKGRRVMVPAGKLAYVEIAEQQSRRVGFTPA